MSELKTLTTKATTTTDRGKFVALAATWSVDRENDQIRLGAFAGSIRKWRESDKQIPLHWNHSADPEDIIGTVDPYSMKETRQGLRVSGQLDLEESEKAREIWRSVKSGAISLSFGYLVRDERKAKDGVRLLTELDLFEVSLTPSPMNPDTRFLDLKSATGAGETDDDLDAMTTAELRDHSLQLAGKSIRPKRVPVAVTTFEC